MAYDWRDPKVGDIVYKAYTPTKAGKVTKVTPDPSGYHRLVVSQVNGGSFGVISMSARCYETLVEGHARKARNQRAILAQLRKI